MLVARDIGFAYGRQRVFDNLSFRIGKGELCALFGPNGCGKTTLFRCCLNLLKLHSGTLCIDGKDTTSMGVRAMAQAVSYVPQEHGIPFPYKVRDVVVMGRTPYMNRIGVLPRREKKRALYALERLNLSDLSDMPFHRLSGGQRQMVLIARALAQDTRVMLLDEPASNLDFKNQITVWTLLKQLARTGLTVVVCSHDPNHVLWFCDSVLAMKKGQLMAKGHPETVITGPALESLYPGVSDVRMCGDMAMVVPASGACGG